MPLTITILGAGAIGSLFGAFLAQHHHVTLLCRPAHATAITTDNLTITGKTTLTIPLTATENLTNLPPRPDLVLITVKAYDTPTIITQTTAYLQTARCILTLQNGLGNLEQLLNILPAQKIYAGITTHGAIYTKPGHIQHTGKGRTIIGSYHPTSQSKAQYLADLFSKTGIPTTVSKNIQQDLWKKAIINSSINPLTTIFQCPNGYLIKNPLLNTMTNHICTESTTIANTQGYHLKPEEMLHQTQTVIQETKNNYSSMLQSLQNHHPTEINQINGYLKDIAHTKKIPAPLNSLLTTIIHTLTN
ncbi:MAG: 2-dehydropantoate 2-reductase [Candidatus Thermoplasmatota archaeon]|nr:2-dehydropantoate 2-reductase [Candidatus Thermoplasmatota archaeon]MBU1940757.1 2-dehydropantoate 2-reductase [Candidatus Thermoplasmatota archaeon]